MTKEKQEKKIHFGDILEYVPNDRKERFINDLILYVPHLKEEADKFSHVIHNVAIGTNMRNYINLVKDMALKVYNATGEKNRKRENILYRQLVYWMMYKTLPVTLGGIGSEFENKNHATILHGVKMFENTMETSWKDRMVVQYFVERMEELGYPQPRQAYRELFFKLKIQH
jgi:chromosomal replication initiation ATPase DnaA